MMAEDRVKAIVEFGFTERQARFLVTVMLHSGVCLLRQYTTFAGIVHGQKTRKFFAKLVKKGYASAYPCRHNRGRVYHVHHKPLYRAIDETDSRHRRPLSAARVVENLMLIDALLSSPSVVWLATEEEKEAHLSGLAGIGLAEAARVTRCDDAPRTIRSARQRMPIGVDLTGRWVFVYVASGDPLDDLHWLLQQHSGLLAALPAWSVRIVFPPNLASLQNRYEEHVRHELASPHPRLVNQLRWYFKQRQAKTAEGKPVDDKEAYDEAHFAFRAARYQVLFGRWLREGDAAFEAVSSPATADAINRGAGRIEYHVLPFSYRHLSPLVGLTRPQAKGPRRVMMPEHGLGPLSRRVFVPLITARKFTSRCTRDDAKRLRHEHLSRAGSASRRDEVRRSLPPENSSLGTTIGA
jgi:hypothetical protein